MLGSLGATVLFRGATQAWPLAGSRASKLTVRDRLVLPPTRPSVPQRSTATPPPRPAIQPAWVPPSRTQPPIWLRLREVRDEESTGQLPLPLPCLDCRIDLYEICLLYTSPSPRD